MFARIFGAAVLGLHGRLITVEADIANGLPAFDIVGMATVAVKESKERVNSRCGGLRLISHRRI